MSAQEKTIYICTYCNSDNVQIKAWVKPNENNLFVAEVNNGDELGWCNDCNLTTVIQTVAVKKNAKIIGFQVVGEDGTPEEGEMHPHIDASFCVYSLPQARAMLDDNDNGNERWRLMTIWEGDIEEPTMMFTGDPQEPMETQPSNGTIGSL